MSTQDGRVFLVLERDMLQGNPILVPVAVRATEDAVAQSIDLISQENGKPKRDYVVRIFYLNEGACPDYSRCDWYRGEGICSFGCYDEPRCQTMLPAEEGWPEEIARKKPAAEVLYQALASDECPGDMRLMADYLASLLDNKMLLVDQPSPEGV